MKGPATKRVVHGASALWIVAGLGIVLGGCGDSGRVESWTAESEGSGRPPAAGRYFLRGDVRVGAAVAGEAYTVVLDEPASRAPLAGEVGRNGELVFVRGSALSARTAHQARGRVLPAYRIDGAARPRFATPYLYARPVTGTGDGLDAWLRRNDLTLASRLYLEDWVYVRTSQDPIDVARALVERGEALASEPSFVVGTTLHGLAPLATNDPYFAESWTLHNTGAITSADGKGQIRGADHAHVAEAWQLLVRLGKATRAEDIGASVRLGVIDDGFDLAHEDLASRFVATRNFGGPVEPNNLFSNTSPKDFHGTMVTGIAAAAGNDGVGLAGACPGCRIVAARMSSGTPAGTTTDQYYDSIFTWVMQQSPDVINCSWGPDDTVATSYYDALVQKITTTGRAGKGTVLVFASGNDGADFAGNALASHPRSITVGASDSTGLRRAFSNYGSGLDLLAPTSGAEKTSGLGTTQYVDRIWTTDNFLAPACLPPGGTPSSSCSDTAGWTPTSPQAGGDRWVGKYTFRFSHTSSAAPLVSGIVAVMLHANPALTVDDVQSVLHDTADEVSPADAAYDATGFSLHYGYGRINALRAVARAYELGGGVIDPATRADIDQASPCTRASCGGAVTPPDAGVAPHDGGTGDAASGSAEGGGGGGDAPPGIDAGRGTGTGADGGDAPGVDVTGGTNPADATPAGGCAVVARADGASFAPAAGAGLALALAGLRRARRRTATRDTH